MQNSKIKVLVCDDDPEILYVTGMLLEEAGFATIIQLNSSLVVEQAMRQQPDVLLIDLWMPCLPGDKLTRQIRQTPPLAHIPIILFSAAVDGNAIAQNIGADGFIEKPFDLEVLTKTIHRLVA